MTAGPPEVPAELEIDADAAFQRAQWMVQRVAWALLTLVPSAAVLGVFGGGPASRRAVETPAARLQYERFARREARTTLRVRVDPSRLRSDTVRVGLDTEYAANLHLDEIVPSPISMRAAGDFLELTFRVDTTHGVPEIRLESRPKVWGRLDGRVVMNGVPFPGVRHFVWP